MKKTSPSGGGLHPIEIYPLVLNAEGLTPGLYHYSLERHAFDQLEALDVHAARDLANELTAGQRYTRNAGVLFLMTARFFRNFWKYRRHDKAYSVLQMDAAHLSQTLYLVCAELGLGAFFTAAVNGRNIEQRLGLDGFQEGALAVCGCGHATADSLRVGPQFQDFEATENRV
ncbi:MAG: SagB family peptide dehydrogenase [Acidobacteriota bacterium]